MARTKNRLVLLAQTHHGVSVEGHDDAGHTEVRHRQGDDEVVGDVLEGPLPGHRQYHLQYIILDWYINIFLIKV